MPNSMAVSRPWSVFSLQTLALPANSSATCSMIGASILHGPHHGAQKSTRTGSCEAMDRLVETGIRQFDHIACHDRSFRLMIDRSDDSGWDVRCVLLQSSLINHRFPAGSSRTRSSSAGASPTLPLHPPALESARRAWAAAPRSGWAASAAACAFLLGSVFRLADGHDGPLHGLFRRLIRQDRT